MKKFYSLSLTTFVVEIALSSLWATVSLAQLQIPAKPQPDFKTPKPANIDDIPNYPQQMKTWSCSKDSQVALVEVKDVKNWSETISVNGWNCQEKLSAIPDKAPQFSCESNDVPINIITVTWLAGEGGKQQMNTWIDAFQNRQMTCTTDTTNPFWN
jgi:hypothetical protein